MSAAVAGVCGGPRRRTLLTDPERNTQRATVSQQNLLTPIRALVVDKVDYCRSGLVSGVKGQKDVSSDLQHCLLNGGQGPPTADLEADRYSSDSSQAVVQRAFQAS